MSSKRKARSAETTGSRKSSRRGKGGDGKDPSIDNRLADTKPEEILELFESEELDQGEEDEGEDEEKYGVVILDVRSSEEILKDGFLDTMGANTGEIRQRCFVEWVHVDGSMGAGWKLLKATASNRFHSCRTPIIVHCATGKKAAEAKKVLTKLNYQCVYNAGAYAALKYLQDYLNGFERLESESAVIEFLKDKPKAMVLDISTSDEPEADDDWFPKCSHDCNHISGWDETEFHGSIGEEDRKTPIIICTKWGRRSAKAKHVLTKLGFNGGILCAGGIATLKPLLEAEKKGGLDRKPAAKDDEEGEKEETQEDATDNEEDASEGGGAKLEGMVFAITGTLSMKRAEFETLLKEHGGVLKGSVTKDVTHLISARDDTAKAKKAKASGVEILKEEAVLSMIGK